MIHYYKKKKNFFACKILLGTLFLTAASTSIGAQVQIMVDDDGGPFTNASNHSTWATATSDLQAAIDAAAAATGGGTIWIAGGTYYPTKLQAADPGAPVPPPIDPSNPSSGDNPREASFVMASNVTVAGGFEGNETSLSDRPSDLFGASNRVILNGDIGVSDDKNDNAYHVVLFPLGVDETAVLRDVYITNGYANGDYYFASRGAGVHMREGGIVNNCVITENGSADGGGGAYLYKGGTITNSEISNNLTSTLGAGVLLNLGGTVSSTLIHSNHADGSDPGDGSGNPSNGGGVFFDSGSGLSGTLTHSLVIGNLSNNKGGGIGTYGEANIINNLIANNKAVGSGGGVHFQSGGLLVNNTVVSNYADSGSGIYADTGGEIYNTVIWNNGTPYPNPVQIMKTDESTVVDHSAIQGGFTGDNVTNIIALDADNSGTGTNPEFRNPVAYQEFPIESSQLALLLSSDYRINLTSALLNAGDPDGSGLPIPSTDLGGDPRITKTVIDIGVYEALYYTVTGSVVNGNGTISPTGPENFLSGENVLFTLTPNVGYEVAAFSINSINYTSQITEQEGYSTYTVTGISEDLDVSVEFSIVNALPDNQEEQFKVYPIPADNQLNFEGVQIKSIKIYSADGKLVKSLERNIGSEINISELKNGLYILILTDKNDETHPVRFIKK